ncbi:M16 family metallopeptidase [Rothia sp. P7181]|uniref:M16 family metallopeptidase n=1 Tax=Rothia sp. P7181 TaxID=3402663 RepID=UPI003AE9A93C
MAILLPTSWNELRDELDYENGKIIEQGEGGHEVRRSVLPGGIRVITEKMPALQSVSLGFWVGVGSRDEQAGMYGSTHFLEHLLFKGTAQRTALDIAEAFDSVGGDSNAFTAKEQTCYYARVLTKDMPLAIDVMADMLAHSLLDEELLEKERQVILEELAMGQDDPVDVAFESFTEQLLGTHPLGRPVGGTVTEIEDVPRQSVWEHYRHYYTPEQLVITAAGGLEHREVVQQVLEAFSRYGWELPENTAPIERRAQGISHIADGINHKIIDKGCEQTHILLGVHGIISQDDRRYALNILNSAFGGGMSSRLFQEVREKRGLAYSTSAFSNSYSDAGIFGMYAGCLPDKTEQVQEILRTEFDKLAQDGLHPEELKKVIGQMQGSMLLGYESPESRMTRLGVIELGSGIYRTLEESSQKLCEVTLEQVQELAQFLAQQEMTTTIVR